MQRSPIFLDAFPENLWLYQSKRSMPLIYSRYKRLEKNEKWNLTFPYHQPQENSRTDHSFLRLIHCKNNKYSWKLEIFKEKPLHAVQKYFQLSRELTGQTFNLPSLLRLWK